MCVYVRRVTMDGPELWSCGASAVRHCAVLGCIELGLAGAPNLEQGVSQHTAQHTVQQCRLLCVCSRLQRQMSWREVLELTIRSPGHGQTPHTFFTTIDSSSRTALSQVLGEEEPDALDERVTMLPLSRSPLADLLHVEEAPQCDALAARLLDYLDGLQTIASPDI